MDTFFYIILSYFGIHLSPPGYTSIPGKAFPTPDGIIYGKEIGANENLRISYFGATSNPTFLKENESISIFFGNGIVTLTSDGCITKKDSINLSVFIN